MSTLNTLAPSFASRAAKGLPTTSDLLIIVTTFLSSPTPPRCKLQPQSANPNLLYTLGNTPRKTHPLALSPYFNNLLYTPTYSNTLTMANGVHGRMDFTVPGGGASDSSVVDFVVDGSGVGRWDGGMGRRVDGEMNRMLLSAFFDGVRRRAGENMRRGKRTA
jgi:hypothetical protein